MDEAAAEGTRRRLPPLNALKIFEAAARHESFTRAAEELCVTQGAVSHQVKALEDAIPDTYMVLSPREGLPAPVFASDWSKQIQLTGADDPRLDCRERRGIGAGLRANMGSRRPPAM